MATVQIGHLQVIDVRDQFPDVNTPDSYYGVRDLAAIDAKIFHHSVTNPSLDPLQSLQAIYDSHRRQGWPGIGYHLIISRDGRIWMAGGAETIRGHVFGRNETSLGICLIGDFTSATPDLRQLVAARRLSRELDFALGRAIPSFGHRAYVLPGRGTACPGNTVYLWLPLVLDDSVEDEWSRLDSRVTGDSPVVVD